jgi:hypothetical protein
MAPVVLGLFGLSAPARRNPRRWTPPLPDVQTNLGNQLRLEELLGWGRRGDSVPPGCWFAPGSRVTEAND